MNALHRTVALIASALCLLFAAVSDAHADETDQFTLPLDPPFAELGDFFSLVHYRVIERVVERTNSDIVDALRLPNEGRRESVLNRLHDPGTIADRVRHVFGPGFLEMRALEEFLYSQKLKDRFPGKVTAYRTPGWIYLYTHLPFDPRRLVLLFQSSTVRAYDVYFGTDKFGHFHDLGHIYYKHFLRLRNAGLTDEEALSRVVREYSQGLISEGALIGFWATGVHSNGDLASNYAGFKFYKNLTEPTQIQGETRPPMLIRIGDFWAMNVHVRPDAAILKPFISDHWNEALNPSLYEWGMRGPIASRLRDMAEDIITFYCELDGRPREREYFDNLVVELSTWFGEDYGHPGVDDRLVTIGNTCFPAVEGDGEPDADDEGEVEYVADRASYDARAAGEHE